MSRIKTSYTTREATIFACKDIAKAFNENIFELSRVRKEWTPGYAQELKCKIDQIIDKYYKERRELKKDSGWQEFAVVAIRDLSLFRAELKVDFKEDKSFLKTMLKQLGYNDHYDKAKNGSQQGLTALLCNFKHGMDEQMVEKVTTKGIDKKLVNRILGYANEMQYCCMDFINEKNICEEKAKEEEKAIYKEVKDICRIASSYYMLEPQKKEMFSFSKVLRGAQS